MNRQNLATLHEHFRQRGIQAALLSSPWTLTWLTGYAPPIQTGPSPFEGGPTLGWWRDGDLTLITSDAEAGAARAAGADVRDYAGYSIEEPLAVVAHQSDALRGVIGDGGRPQTVGIEYQFLPGALVGPLQESLPHAAFSALDGSLEPLRAVKTPPEIAAVRASLALCDLGQAEVQRRLTPGVSEIELWGRIKGRLETQVGARVPLMADMVGGVRTGEMGGLPGPYALREGDAVIVDLVPRLDGYWGDNCATYFVGEPPAELRRAYNVVREALHRGMDAVHPGLPARELDARLRGWISDAGFEPHPHHSGHGIGVSFHEEPRIVPYNETRLAAGMVVALEPGVYLPGLGGVRLENVVLVTDGGCEVLTQHLSL